jgi:DNA-binding NtrC family response regulator
MLDLVMPQMDGLAVLKTIRPNRPTLPVIVLTAKGGIDTVVTAMRAGADDFVVKPASPERIQVSIQNALKLNALNGEITRLTKRSSNSLGFEDLIAESAAMKQVIKVAERAAHSNIPILIGGESGVGKEVIARAIQGGSDRAGKPFVTVNCGAIPENLVESILFGHEKGAFTGATEKHLGKFQEANGGTLFLDEIGELRPDMQVKLLRALQEGEVDPIGAKKPVKVDIRLISATNKDLFELSQTGGFREDLYYRLNVFPVDIPPLRQRKEDIPALVDLFVRRFAVEEGKKLVGIDTRALEMLAAYSWPGNVRQLENTVFRGVVLCDGDKLTVGDFPQIAASMGVEIPPADAEDGPVTEFEGVLGSPEDEAAEPGGWASRRPEEALAERLAAEDATGRPIKVIAESDLPPRVAPAEPEVPVMTEDGHLRAIEEVEADMIRLAIDRYNGHMSEVARRLGIGRSTLYRKVRDLGLEVRASGTG